MRIAFTSMGNSLDSQLDSRFGRAKSFLLYDTEKEVSEVIDNSVHLNAAQGAGIQAAGNVADAKADILITGHCGPKAFRVLSKAGISVYTTDAKTVKEALDLFRNGKLEKASDADVEGHW